MPPGHPSQSILPALSHPSHVSTPSSYAIPQEAAPPQGHPSNVSLPIPQVNPHKATPLNQAALYRSPPPP